jgi:hypothetical protein
MPWSEQVLIDNHECGFKAVILHLWMKTAPAVFKLERRDRNWLPLRIRAGTVPAVRG